MDSQNSIISRNGTAEIGTTYASEAYNEHIQDEEEEEEEITPAELIEKLQQVNSIC